MTRLLFNSIGSLDAFRVAGSMLKRLNRCLAAIWSTKTYQNHATAFAVCVSNSFGYFGADQQRATKRQLLTKLHNPAQSLDCILFGQRNDMRTSLFPSLSLSLCFFGQAREGLSTARRSPCHWKTFGRFRRSKGSRSECL